MTQKPKKGWDGRTKPGKHNRTGKPAGWLRVGNTEGVGRKPDAFKAMMRDLADRAARALAVAEILDNPTHELYLPAAKWAAEQGYGKPAQAITLEQSEPLTIRVVRE